MKRKFLAGLIAMCLVLIGVFALSACFGKNSDYEATEDWTRSLEFEQSSNGNYYTVSGISNKTIEKVVIPSTYDDLPVCKIGYAAFMDCKNITSVTIPDSIESIGMGAFSDCTSLTSVTIPNSVKKIAMAAFDDCTSLKSVTIPVGISELPQEAFDGCISLTSITFEGTMEQWNAIGKGSDWNYNTGEYTVHCTDGDIPKY